MSLLPSRFQMPDGKAQRHESPLAAFERSLREQMRLAGAKEPTNEMRIRAFDDANYATFNNPTIVATGWTRSVHWLKQQGISGRLTAFSGEMVVPFARTPSNIVARVIDYTPVGGVPRAAVSLGRAMRDKGMTAEQQRAFSQAIGRGATGSALLWLGWWLADQGLATGIREEDSGKRALNEAAGRQYGAIKVDGKWRKVDAFSPNGNLIVLGATIHRELGNAGLAGLSFAGAKTVMEQPMAKGLADAIDFVESPVKQGHAYGGRLAGSFVPSAVADVASLTDEKRRDTRSDTASGSVAAGVSARVPGLRNRLPERRDVLGRPQPQMKSAVVDPTFTMREDQNPALQEMLRVGASMDYGKKRDTESAADYNLRAEVTGAAILRRVEQLMGQQRYQSADTEAKRDLVKNVIHSTRAKASAFSKTKQYQQMDGDERREYLNRHLLTRGQ